MTRRRRSKAPQVHPTGPLETVDESFKDDMRAEMRRRGMDQGDLAAKLDVSEGSITKLFKPGPKQIRYKDRIEKLFGWNADPEKKAKTDTLSRRAAFLDMKDIDAVLSLVDSLASKRTPGTF